MKSIVNISNRGTNIDHGTENFNMYRPIHTLKYIHSLSNVWYISCWYCLHLLIFLSFVMENKLTVLFYIFYAELLFNSFIYTLFFAGTRSFESFHVSVRVCGMCECVCNALFRVKKNKVPLHLDDYKFREAYYRQNMFLHC